MVEDRMTVDASRDVSAILTAEHLRLILKEHLLTPEELNDPDRLRGLVQSMVDKAIGFPEDAWHQWDDWAKGLE